MDETFGDDWQCDYKEVNGVTYCGIAVRDKKSGEWLWRWNAGSEGNFEKEKAVASSAFKRACVALGLGRELYTAPRVIVQADKYETFKAAEIRYEDDVISALKIVNGKGDVVFNYPGGANTRWSAEMPEKPKEATPKTNSEKLKNFCSQEKLKEGVDIKVLKKFFEYYDKIIDSWDNKPNFSKLWEKWLERER